MNDQYPRGKLNDSDEGVLEIRIAMRDNTLIIDFGKGVNWIGMSRIEAQDFALRILRLAADSVVTVDMPDP